MTPIHTALLQVGLSLLVAVTTAFLTIWLSLRRFYREKWWEAKMRAYSDVIQALHHMKWDLEISLRAHEEGRDTDTDYHKAWSAKHSAAWEEIRKQTDVGEFLFSPKAVELLQMLSNEARHETNEGYFQYLEKIQVAVEKCLPAIKAAARTDLGLPTLRSFLAKPTTSIK